MTKVLCQGHLHKNAGRACGGFELAGFLWRFQAWMFGTHQAEGSATVLLAHGGMKIGCGQVLRVRLMGLPFHEEAVAQAAEQAHDEDAGREANPAAVVIVGDIQALVQPVFDSTKAGSVEL
jgi:hypothetical protein